MKKLMGVLAVACLAVACVADVTPPSKKVMLAFSTMYAVDGPFLNYKIRGVPGDSAPWIIDRVDGSVLEDGYVSIKVRGLIFANGTPNDAETFKARISCLTEEGESKIVEAHVETKEAPANPQGDSDIVDTVKLPDPCVAPIVLIMPGDEDDWFTVTGAGD